MEDRKGQHSMKNMTISNIATACGGTLYLPAGYELMPEQEAACVVIDSRKLIPGGVFIATKGERVDGHQFITQVFEKGALAVVCEKLPEAEPSKLPGPCIVVEDSFAALTKLAAFYRETLSLPIVGITGSVGKTSTKEFIAGVLSAKYRVFKTEGNFNNEIGVPLMLLSIRPEHEVAVLEMGINHFGEMHRLSQMAKPDICVMTNIGQCHLEFLGTRDGILKAKSEIFDYANPDAYVVVNGDDDKLCALRVKDTMTLTHFGLDKTNEVYADQIQMRGLLGSTMQVHTPDLSFALAINLPGRHQVYNALAAACVALHLGLTPQEIEAGARSVQAVGGRGRVIETDQYVILDDCYNANPVSMKAAIDLMCQADGRKVAILGDMFELGEEELALHEQIGTYCVQKGIDVLLCAGIRSEHMAKAALMALSPKRIEVHHYVTREELQQELADLLQPGDTILIKASHGMQFEQLVKELC